MAMACRGVSARRLEPAPEEGVDVAAAELLAQALDFGREFVAFGAEVSDVCAQGGGEQLGFTRAAFDLAAEARGFGGDVVLPRGRKHREAAVGFHPSAALPGRAGCSAGWPLTPAWPAARRARGAGGGVTARVLSR